MNNECVSLFSFEEVDNDFVLLLLQASIALRYLGMRCDLIDDNGSLIDNPTDQEVEFRFNLMLDSLEDWKQSINKREHESFSLAGETTKIV